MTSAVLENFCLILRVPQAQDFEAFAELHAEVEAMRFIGGSALRAAAWRKFPVMPGAWVIQDYVFHLGSRAPRQVIPRAFYAYYKH